MKQQDKQIMKLDGLNVLVDGYNLGLLHGTGIKTYGLTLIEALKLLGTNVNVLFGSPRKSSRDPILNEVLFFDNQDISLSKLSLLKHMTKAFIGIPNKAKKVTSDINTVIKDGIDNNFLDPLKIFNLSECYTSASRLHNILRINTTITIPQKIDVWHATYPLPVKIKKAKKITTIHDLIPLRLPYTTLDDKREFYRRIKDSIKESAIVITVSENSKKDILKIFDINPDKIYVTYQPIKLGTVIPNKEIISAFLRTYKIKYKNYILFVGAIEPKKNIGRLIDAYSGLDHDIPLVIVGKKGWLWEGEIGHLESLFGKKFQRKVKLLEHVSVDSLRYLYAGANCLVFPSLYEGFGLPPLEAMSLGCPVITSNISSLPEVCGDAALYVDPYDTHDIREKMEILLSDSILRDKLSEAGKERAKLFSMENYTRRLYKAYSIAL